MPASKRHAADCRAIALHALWAALLHRKPSGVAVATRHQHGIVTVGKPQKRRVLGLGAELCAVLRTAQAAHVAAHHFLMLASYEGSAS